MLCASVREQSKHTCAACIESTAFIIGRILFGKPSRSHRTESTSTKSTESRCPYFVRNSSSGPEVSIATASNIEGVAFRPDSVLATHSLKVITYKKGSYYDKVRGREIRVPARSLALQDRTIPNRSLFYTLAFVVTGTFLAVAVRAKGNPTAPNSIKL